MNEEKLEFLARQLYNRLELEKTPNGILAEMRAAIDGEATVDEKGVFHIVQGQRLKTRNEATTQYIDVCKVILETHGIDWQKSLICLEVIIYWVNYDYN